MKFKDALKRSIDMFDKKEFIERIREEDDTMVKNMPILKEINKKGYLTTESQAGKKTKGKHYLDGKPYEMWERAYITGFMEESRAIEFIKDMGIYTDKTAVYIPTCSGDINIPRALDIPLTIVKKDNKIEVHTHTSMALPNDVGEFFRKQVKIDKSEKVVYIICWDTKWGRIASGKEGLFTDVLRVLTMT